MIIRAKKLKIIAITGTKGKTTTSWLLYHMLKTAGLPVALLSTVKNKIGDQEFKGELTTQHPDYLHTFFACCVHAGVSFVVMEVAAQALSLNRVDGLEFDGFIFTNFSAEHAEFYPSLDEYFAAKMELFSQVKTGSIQLVNADDEWCKERIIGRIPVASFGIRNTEYPSIHPSLTGTRDERENGVKKGCESDDKRGEK